MQTLAERLVKHAQYIEYHDKLSDFDSLFTLFSDVMSNKCFDPLHVDKDAVVTYMQNGIHWAKRRDKSHKTDSPEEKIRRAKRRDAFETHCVEILDCIPSTEEWIQAFNKPDKWDNRLLIQECLVQRKTGMLLAPILLNKFKANLFHRGNLIMNPNRTIEETMDSALHMLFTNALSEEAELYDYRRLKLILTSIVKERKDYSFKARHALMCLKNNKQQTVYDILLQHSDRINKSSYRDQCYTLLRDWCTKEKFNAIFHTNIYTACKPHYKQQVLHA